MGESPYQDLVDAGGLEAVLRAACPDCDIEMQEASGAFGGYLAVVYKNDRSVRVQPMVGEREFFVAHKHRRMYLSWLTTTDLAEVTGSTATWLGGATARELAAAWPFADFVDVADAYESGDRIELGWQLFRQREYPALIEFIEAAMREPRLRRMYPFRSVWGMSFRPTADSYRVPGPWVRPADEGRVKVTEYGQEKPGVTYDPAEAVRVCMAEMDRLGVPSREEFLRAGETGISG